MLHWTKTMPQFFIIDYQEGHTYEPDFIVEIEKAIYLCEIKRASYKRDIFLYALRYNLFVA